MKKYIIALCSIILVPSIIAIAATTSSVQGKIVLQVEEHGEAWYISPMSLTRYYLGRPFDAFIIMSDLGIGIAHNELAHYLETIFPQRLAGLILLDVQKNGEAYYIEPESLKGHYLGRPDDAYALMRTLGLGISNNDLNQIPIDTNSRLVPSEPTEKTTNTTQTFDVASAFLDNVSTSINGDTITIKSNGLPNHETGQFPNQGNPNTISEQDIEKSFTLNPQKSNAITNGGGYEFGIAVNGIFFEPLTGEYYNNDRTSGWNLEWSTNNLGFDFNNAHVQPDGSYHYHGSPTSLLALIDGKSQTLIGFAADGFPIYIENLTSSYRLKAGTRPSGPGGTYDGTYVQDYEYIEGLGDLDECNGLFGTTPEYPDGTYYYVVSESFPIISRCFSGAPDNSFKKGAGGLPTGGIQPGNPPPQRLF